MEAEAVLLHIAELHEYPYNGKKENHDARESNRKEGELRISLAMFERKEEVSDCYPRD